MSLEAVPETMTLLTCRHLLKAYALIAKIFVEVAARLDDMKLLMKEGTIVDATIESVALLDEEQNKRARS